MVGDYHRDCQGGRAAFDVTAGTTSPAMRLFGLLLVPAGEDDSARWIAMVSSPAFCRFRFGFQHLRAKLIAMLLGRRVFFQKRSRFVVFALRFERAGQIVPCADAQGEPAAVSSGRPSQL